MTTQAQAEALAKRAISEYLTACDMPNREGVANALMKLCSVAGVLMACAEGREIAAQRLEGTAEFVRRNGPQFPREINPLQ